MVFIHGEEWSIYGPELGEFERCSRQVSVSPVLASVVYPLQPMVDIPPELHLISAPVKPRSLAHGKSLHHTTFSRGFVVRFDDTYILEM